MENARAFFAGLSGESFFMCDNLKEVYWLAGMNTEIFEDSFVALPARGYALRAARRKAEGGGGGVGEAVLQDR